MKRSGKSHKSVIVNSFKGGCGKTTLALSICVSAAMEDENKYDNIYYFDIDVSGTGSFYKLFDEIDINKKTESPIDKCPKLLDYYGENDCQSSLNNIVLNNESDGHSYSFYAICINPKTRIDKSLYENTSIRFDPVVIEDPFVGRIFDFVKKKNDEAKSSKTKNLYIFDCSPGLNRLERELAIKLESMPEMDVNEVFVTSYDNSHINKTVVCLSDYCFLKEKFRKVYILINDIHNINYIEEHYHYNFTNILEDVNELFVKNKVKGDVSSKFIVYKNNFKGELCNENLIGYTQNISNSFRNYDIRTENFYKEVISVGTGNDK